MRSIVGVFNEMYNLIESGMKGLVTIPKKDMFSGDDHDNPQAFWGYLQGVVVLVAEAV